LKVIQLLIPHDIAFENGVYNLLALVSVDLLQVEVLLDSLLVDFVQVVMGLGKDILL